MQVSRRRHGLWATMNLVTCVGGLAACAVIGEVLDFSDCTAGPGGRGLQCTGPLGPERLPALSEQISVAGDSRNGRYLSTLPLSAGSGVHTSWRRRDSLLTVTLDTSGLALRSQADPTWCWAEVVRAMLRRAGFVYSQCQVVGGYAARQVAGSDTATCALQRQDLFGASLEEIRAALEGRDEFTTRASRVGAYIATRRDLSSNWRELGTRMAAARQVPRFATSLLRTGRAVGDELVAGRPVILGLAPEGNELGHVVLLLGARLRVVEGCMLVDVRRRQEPCREDYEYASLLVFDPWGGRLEWVAGGAVRRRVTFAMAAEVLTSVR